MIMLLIGGNDIFDYPLTILPKDHGRFSGTLMFIAKSTKIHNRYLLLYSKISL